MDALQHYLDSVRSTPFQWGEHDCALFAAKGVDVIHGTNFVSRVRAFNCRSGREYRALLREGVTLEALTTAELGLPVATTIHEGDVVLARVGGRQVLTLASPPLLFAAGPDGLLPLPLSAALRAWRVV